MIQIKNLNKSFYGHSSVIHAVSDISLSIEDADIFGIIGFSGAGKSTLVRCINLLERPDSGEVIVNGKDLMKLSNHDLRLERRKIGMIFQHFNLFRSRTVGANIAYPLKYTGISKKSIDARVKELLDIVGLVDKEHVYPSHLSGGQKQRVGIARALASNPSILLCDEATSALDPHTTQSILALLKDLNKKLGLTMVIITHEMNVVKTVCSHAVVMEKGRIMERGSIFDIFSNPQEQTTKDFISTTSSLHKIYDLIECNSPIIRLSPNQILAHFHYVGKNTIEALISKASVVFNIHINIIFGDLDIIQDTPVGGLINIVEGKMDSVEAAIQWFGKQGVHVEVIKRG
jgi:D-methionine transport system ATP-binding protein